MITEDYISFETAKLLKEKGFDCLCHSYFRKDNPNNLVKEACGANWNDTPFFTSRPTLQMAIKWLREVHKLEIYPFHDAIQEDNNWWYRVELHTKGYGVTEHESDVIYKTYEEAVEAAIKYCLENLI